VVFPVGHLLDRSTADVLTDGAVKRLVAFEEIDAVVGSFFP